MEAVAAILNENGIPVSVPWESTMDDREMEVFLAVEKVVMLVMADTRATL
jgi:hypothetical protein